MNPKCLAGRSAHPLNETGESSNNFMMLPVRPLGSFARIQLAFSMKISFYKDLQVLLQLRLGQLPCKQWGRDVEVTPWAGISKKPPVWCWQNDNSICCLLFLRGTTGAVLEGVTMLEDNGKFKSYRTQGMAGKSFHGPNQFTPIDFQIKKAQLTNQKMILPPSC